MSLLFLVPLISGAWSDDKTQWLQILRIKLPLALLPLAFASSIEFSKRQWQWLAVIFLAAMMIATAWTFGHYLSELSTANESYLKAKTMLTPLKNDHVRFSWIVSIAALVSGWLFFVYKPRRKIFSSLLLMLTLWFVVFLHL